MNPSQKRKIRKLISPFRRIGLDNKDFSIISNNCWGGVVYDIFGMQYLSPTIGLYFFADEYIKFLSNLNYYLSIDAEPLDFKNSKYKDVLIERNQQNAPLGIIDDVEIVFVHYANAEDAVMKWNRRRKRVNYNNLLIKCSDQNLFNENNYKDFVVLNYKNKIFFTSNSNMITEPYCCFIPDYAELNEAIDDIGWSKKNYDYKQLLNNMVR